MPDTTAAASAPPMAQVPSPQTLPPADSTKPTTATSAEPTPPVPADDPVPKVHLHVLVISGKYHVFSFEPETTVGRAKELIWSMWPTHWTDPAQPPAPSWLKILYSGRVLADESTLAVSGLPVSKSPATPTVVHLSVRSFSLKGDDDTKKAGLTRTTTHNSTRAAQREEDVGGCKCIIM